MARPIDEKIVKMTLDNESFKARIKETVNGFRDLDRGIKNANGLNLSKMAEGISAIERRFSAAGVVIATVISNITSKVMTLGANLVRGVMDPLVEGGKKRALNIEQAKFQFEGLGMDIEKTMNSALEAVKGTAFGLDEAAVVASQFGATGMRAGDEMTAALRGISGVAAMTGSSYSDIGNIFTTVAGNGRLMGSELLRLSSRGVNAAATLAKSMGKSEAEVREMVSKGKISFEMFAEAMNDAFGEHATKANQTYTGSLSNVRAALARIGAAIYAPGFDNKRDIFNTLTPKIDDMATALGPLIEAWTQLNKTATDNLIKFIDGINIQKFVELGGAKNLVSAFWSVMNTGTTILKSVSEGFKRVFPPATAETFVRISQIIKDLAMGMTLSAGTAGKLTTIFQGVFSIFSTVWEIAKRLAQTLFGLIPEGLGGSVLDILVKLAEMAIAFNESVKAGNGFTDSIEAMGGVLGKFGGWVMGAIGSIIGFARNIREYVGPTLDWLREKLAPVGKFLKETFSGFGLQEVMGGGALAGILVVVKKVSDAFGNFSGIFGAFKGAVSGVGRDFRGHMDSLFGGLGDALKSFQEKVKYDNLLKIAIAIGILAVSLKLLEGMESEDIIKGVTALATSMAVLAGGMKILDKYNITGGLRASVTIIALSIAVGLMAVALKKISDLNPDEMIVGVSGLVGIVTALSLAVIAISKWGGKIKAGSIQLIALATAVYILAGAVEKMSGIDAGNLWKAVGALGVIFLELAIFLKIVDRTKFNIASAVGIVVIAGAIHIMVAAISKIAELDWVSLGKGMATLAAILLSVALFSKIANGPLLMAAGAGLVLVAAAIFMLVGPITTFANMSWEELGRGLGAMAIALVAVAGAAMLATGSIAGAAAITVMAVALNLLLIPIKAFAAMTWTELLIGIGGMAIALAALAVTAMLLSPAVVPMLSFGAAVALMGVAMLAAGAGVALFGIGLATLAGMTAASVAAIVAALRMLIIGLGDLIVDIVQFIVKVGVALIDGIMALVPPLLDAVIKLIFLILDVLTKHLPKFIDMGVLLIVQLIDGIGRALDPLIEALVNLVISAIEALSKTIREQGPRLIAVVMELLGEILILFIEAGLQVINALLGWIPGVNKATAEIGEGAADMIRATFGASEVGSMKGQEFIDSLEKKQSGAEKAGKTIGKAGKDGADSIDLSPVGSKKGQDFSKALGAKKGEVEGAGKSIGMAGRDGAGSIQLNPTGSKKGQEFATAFGNKKGSAQSAGKGLATAGRSGASSINLNSVGSNFGSSFASGMSSGSTISKVASAARGLARVASDRVKGWLGIASPSKVAIEDGGWFGEGLALGILDKVKRVGDSAKDLAMTAKDSLHKFIEGFEPDMDDNEIHFRAVVEYDDFDPDGFGGPRTIGVVPDTSLTSGLVAATKSSWRQNEDKTPTNNPSTESKNATDEKEKQPAIIQVVTPDRREVAKWVVDDVTEFQEFNLARTGQF